MPKSHVCAFCRRAFSRSEHRKRHERSHQGVKPFQCAVCNHVFVRRDLLKRHIKTVHRAWLLEHGQDNSQLFKQDLFVNSLIKIAANAEPPPLKDEWPSSKSPSSKSPSEIATAMAVPPALTHPPCENKISAAKQSTSAISKPVLKESRTKDPPPPILPNLLQLKLPASLVQIDISHLPDQNSTLQRAVDYLSQNNILVHSIQQPLSNLTHWKFNSNLLILSLLSLGYSLSNDSSNADFIWFHAWNIVLENFNKNNFFQDIFLPANILIHTLLHHSPWLLQSHCDLQIIKVYQILLCKMTTKVYKISKKHTTMEIWYFFTTYSTLLYQNTGPIDNTDDIPNLLYNWFLNYKLLKNNYLNVKSHLTLYQWLQLLSDPSTITPTTVIDTSLLDIIINACNLEYKLNLSKISPPPPALPNLFFFQDYSQLQLFLQTIENLYQSPLISPTPSSPPILSHLLWSIFVIQNIDSSYTSSLLHSPNPYPRDTPYPSHILRNESMANLSTHILSTMYNNTPLSQRDLLFLIDILIFQTNYWLPLSQLPTSNATQILGSYYTLHLPSISPSSILSFLHSSIESVAINYKLSLSNLQIYTLLLDFNNELSQKLSTNHLSSPLVARRRRRRRSSAIDPLITPIQHDSTSNEPIILPPLLDDQLSPTSSSSVQFNYIPTNNRKNSLTITTTELPDTRDVRRRSSMGFPGVSPITALPLQRSSSLNLTNSTANNTKIRLPSTSELFNTIIQ
ncbi:hypothetical protein TBLA_0I02700 [Henningerozyma blattae CBS 6284]|uniref:C2H2-type domain-containing protein n=1 Tax=Henningerozyma blattae (strain ATCC 34711 / CBS 6284 / DSM 70876 / NBRC 10599 / NRRL Y-10934 / UCD 77-7) TaxID=1071380 RepID=I2H974_HENB6|nr:hypothetical protein TBLA_0I02700 [Tetrapisispora blattae CBS 6284]CCH62926.1 hypothetical protein TBLA_0I02700 [Tetrapisispora blattae CBS 6284]